MLFSGTTTLPAFGCLLLPDVVGPVFGLVFGLVSGVVVGRKDVLDRATECPRDPESEGKRRIKATLFDGDDGLAADAKFVGKALL